MFFAAATRPLSIPILAISALVVASSCNRFGNKNEQSSSGASSSQPEPGIDSPPPTPKGMIWVPPGVLIAGTPDGVFPRVADAEMPGVQVVMRGFFIDEYPYPNEANAIPKSNVTRDEAQALCEEQHKRLCTELEWERACKGPANQIYPGSNTYNAGDCDTGKSHWSVPPMGLNAHCRTGFGVRDTHGVVWQWTASPWGRGLAGDQVSIRGGNGSAGDVVARCANAIARSPNDRAMSVGFRCCSGERNLPEVTVDVIRGGSLTTQANEPPIIELVLGSPPPDLAKRLAKAQEKEKKQMPFEIFHSWKWRPIGNEEFFLHSGCAGHKPHPVCGITIGRIIPPQSDAGAATYEPVAFAPSQWWMATLHESNDPREFWVVGGDERGAYKRKVSYAFGRVTVGEPERNLGKRKKKGL